MSQPETAGVQQTDSVERIKMSRRKSYRQVRIQMIGQRWSNQHPNRL
ncbi:hypothetical protein KEH51_17635 [[Brevibacterium] frigoritolerans]|uniref:Uncharacterized protein n=1 Tax=Peribacillus frigoritolerans TaxID=450367 RepID=A0A941FJT7_9BACI|nr:hypothetical protein [Peribacillus frigoritolerans]